MTAATATGTAFGSLLRDWRQRRRLTQLELGLAADVSARHLSFLETGRSRPSREMVLLLADELDVPLRGRNELMIAAGFAPAYSQHGLGDAELGEVQRSLRRILDGHEPYRRCWWTAGGTCWPATGRCSCSPIWWHPSC